MAVPEGPFVVGVDSSTQSTKVLIVDSTTGEIVARGQAPHTVTPGPGHESDPEQWWTALRDALDQCGDLVHRVSAISVGGQQHGLVTLDADGRPVRPALLWNDVRSAPQRDRLVEELGGPREWAERMGSVPAPAFTVTKWAWLREHEPESVAATRAVRLPHDYLTERLTGEATTDRGDASGTGWWASRSQTYDERVLEHVGLPPELLPRVLGHGEAAGTVRPQLPLPAGTLVATGTGDNMAAAVGLGLRPGQPVLSLGTSGTVYSVSDHRPADPSGTVSGFADAGTGWLPLACTLNCTLAVDRVAALLNVHREEVSTGGELTMFPFLDGERTPNLPYAAGLLHGLRHDTDSGQVLQAAYDGAVFALLRALDQVLGEDGAEGGTYDAARSADRSGAETPLLLIGGGAKGTAWRQTVLRLSGRPVQVPRAEELVALGAAAQAAGLLLGEDAAAVARRWDTAAGMAYPAVPRDEPTLERLTSALAGADTLLRGARP
ncbi:xylulokinase [Streptomyces oceani]|uniref:Xylulose kinase n=1 Tax=Streptomyces oceani TaxID=1075402 RepID=A0A1E7JY77_9ACTN|nr:xylulokinase [Streptomyces oceani]OEU96621.1 xylulose kinase [Streptomyces oceani]